MSRVAIAPEALLLNRTVEKEELYKLKAKVDPEVPLGELMAGPSRQNQELQGGAKGKALGKIIEGRAVGKVNRRREGAAGNGAHNRQCDAQRAI